MNVMQSMEADLMQLDDESFVRQSYLRLLGRTADADGLSGYLQQLQAGLSRPEVFQLLASSEEGQRYEAKRQSLRRSVTVVSAVCPPRTPAAALAVAPQWWPAPAVVPNGPTPRVAEMQELLALEGAMFVKAAYLALLKREADDVGLANYMRILRDGWSKMHVVRGLMQSPEGEQAKADLPGLRDAVVRHKKAQRRSWGGWYYRSVLGVESDLPAERQLRAAHAAMRALPWLAS